MSYYNGHTKLIVIPRKKNVSGTYIYHSVPSNISGSFSRVCRSPVLTLVFRDCDVLSKVISYRRFGQTCSFHSEDWTNLKAEASVFHETSVITNLHGVTFQNTTVLMNSVVKHSSRSYLLRDVTKFWREDHFVEGSAVQWRRRTIRRTPVQCTEENLKLNGQETDGIDLANECSVDWDYCFARTVIRIFSGTGWKEEINKERKQREEQRKGATQRVSCTNSNTYEASFHEMHTLLS